MSLLIPTVQPGYFGPGSVEVAPPTAPGEGPARRLAINRDKLLTQPREGVETVRDVLEYAARTFGENKAVGWRDIVDVHEERKEVKKVVDGKETVQVKTWKYFELSDYKYLSYVEMEAQVTKLACALLDLGFTPEHVFNIYAQTR
jgi:long-chain acyl-CoA synthetase